MIKPINLYGDSYHDAINSPKWFNEVRPAIIERDHGRCRFCECTENLQVHHIRYQNERGENDYFNPNFLITLCRKCHQIVSDAVEEAKKKTIEVPAFMVRPTSYATVQDQITNSIKRSAYYAESDLIAETCFKLWKRTLDDDCGQINFRSLEILRPIGEVVMLTIEFQAGMTAMGYSASFIERTIRKITEYIAEGYVHYMKQGFKEDDIRKMFKLTPNQMIRVRKNAERICRAGVGGSG